MAVVYTFLHKISRRPSKCRGILLNCNGYVWYTYTYGKRNTLCVPCTLNWLKLCMISLKKALKITKNGLFLLKMTPYMRCNSNLTCLAASLPTI